MLQFMLTRHATKWEKSSGHFFVKSHEYEVYTFVRNFVAYDGTTCKPLPPPPSNTFFVRSCRKVYCFHVYFMIFGTFTISIVLSKYYRVWCLYKTHHIIFQTVKNIFRFNIYAVSWTLGAISNLTGDYTYTHEFERNSMYYRVHKVMLPLTHNSSKKSCQVYMSTNVCSDGNLPILAIL